MAESFACARKWGRIESRANRRKGIRTAKGGHGCRIRGLNIFRIFSGYHETVRLFRISRRAARALSGAWGMGGMRNRGKVAIISNEQTSDGESDDEIGRAARLEAKNGKVGKRRQPQQLAPDFFAGIGAGPTAVHAPFSRNVMFRTRWRNGGNGRSCRRVAGKSVAGGGRCVVPTDVLFCGRGGRFWFVFALYSGRCGKKGIN